MKYCLSKGDILIICLALLCVAPAQSQTPNAIWSVDAHAADVTAVAFSSYEPLAASAGADGSIIIFNSGGSVIRKITTSVSAENLAFSGIDAVAAWDKDGSLSVWQISQGTLIQSQHLASGGGHMESSFSAKGNVLAAMVYESATSVVLRVFQVPQGNVLQTLPNSWPAVSDEGSLIAGLVIKGESDYQVTIWRTDTGVQVDQYQTREGASAGVMAFSADSRILAVLPSVIGPDELWDVTSGGFVGAIADTIARPFTPQVSKFLGFSPDGKVIATINYSDYTRFWVREQLSADVPLQTSYARYAPDEAEITAFAISRNSGTYLYGRSDGKVVLAMIPIFLARTEQTSDGLVLEWIGGNGHYQVQATDSVPASSWKIVIESTAETRVTLPQTEASRFFRVVALPIQ